MQKPTLMAAWLRVRPQAIGWLLDLGLFGFMLVLVAAVWSGLPIWLALTAQLVVLAAWDLGRFVLRQPAVPRGRHLRWLALSLAIGALLAVGALLLRLDLGFELALGLGIVLIVLLTRAGLWVIR